MPPAKRRSFLRTAIPVAVALLLLTCCLWSFQDNSGTSATAAHAAVSGLPLAATNVSWFLPGAFGPVELYEFTIDEAGYEQWVRSWNHSKLEGPKRGQFRIQRYDQASQSFTWRELENTIAYTWKENDMGVYLVYDLDHRRAYYWSHSR